jgi:predicted esterase
MTRQDRDHAIVDNVAYVDRVVEGEIARFPTGTVQAPSLVYLGFSQGASMAYRAAVLGSRAARGVVALAGDIPPELKSGASRRQEWPPVLVGVGAAENWYTPDKVSADTTFLVSQGVKADVCRFAGGHEWTDEFRAAAGRWLDALV